MPRRSDTPDAKRQEDSPLRLLRRRVDAEYRGEEVPALRCRSAAEEERGKDLRDPHDSDSMLDAIMWRCVIVAVLFGLYALFALLAR